MLFFGIVVAAIIGFFVYKYMNFGDIKSQKEKYGSNFDLAILNKLWYKPIPLAFKNDTLQLSFNNEGRTYDLEALTFISEGTDLTIIVPHDDSIHIIDIDEVDMKAMKDYVLANNGNFTEKAVNVLVSPDSLDVLGTTEENAFICKLDGKKKIFFSNDPLHKSYKITSIDFQKTTQTTSTTETQTKGRAGSALVGGLIAGPVGSVVGASRKKNSQSTTVSETHEIPNEGIITLEDSDGKHENIGIVTTSPSVNYIKKHLIDLD